MFLLIFLVVLLLLGDAVCCYFAVFYLLLRCLLDLSSFSSDRFFLLSSCSSEPFCPNNKCVRTNCASLIFRASLYSNTLLNWVLQEHQDKLLSATYLEYLCYNNVLNLDLCEMYKLTLIFCLMNNNVYRGFSQHALLLRWL